MLLPLLRSFVTKLRTLIPLLRSFDSLLRSLVAKLRTLIPRLHSFVIPPLGYAGAPRVCHFPRSVSYNALYILWHNRWLSDWRPSKTECHEAPQKLPNTACTQSPTSIGATLAPHCVWWSAGVVVGLPLCGVRVFRQFPWLDAGSVNAALSRPTHQRVTPTVRQ
jgi:hypothetical protein